MESNSTYIPKRSNVYMDLRWIVSAKCYCKSIFKVWMRYNLYTTNYTYLKCTWWVVTFVHFLETMTKVKTRSKFSSLQNVSLSPLNSFFPLLSYLSSSGTHRLSFCYYRIVCIFVSFCINEIIQYIFFGMTSFIYCNCL